MNEKQFNLLKVSVEHWNRNRPSEIDLIGADLSGMDLSGIELSCPYSSGYLGTQKIVKANLKGAKLRDTILVGARLGPVNLSWSDLFNANFAGAEMACADLWQASCIETNFSQVNLLGACFRCADLKDALFFEAEISGADFWHSDVTTEQLQIARFARTPEPEPEMYY